VPRQGRRRRGSGSATPSSGAWISAPSCARRRGGEPFPGASSAVSRTCMPIVPGPRSLPARGRHGCPRGRPWPGGGPAPPWHRTRPRGWMQRLPGGPGGDRRLLRKARRRIPPPGPGADRRYGPGAAEGGGGDHLGRHPPATGSPCVLGRPGSRTRVGVDRGEIERRLAAHPAGALNGSLHGNEGMATRCRWSSLTAASEARPGPRDERRGRPPRAGSRPPRSGAAPDSMPLFPSSLDRSGDRGGMPRPVTATARRRQPILPLHRLCPVRSDPRSRQAACMERE
jgi:hypothetical protein